MASTINRASELLADAARSLGSVSGDVETARRLLALLGWDLPPGVDDIGFSQLKVSAVATRLDELAELRSRPDTSDLELAAAVGDLVVALADTFAHIEVIARSLHASPNYLSATGIVDKFFPRLADLLVIQAIGSAAPAAVPFGTLLGLFEFALMPANPATFQVEHVRQIVRWDRFSPLLTNPTGVLHDVYGWGTADFKGNSLVTNIGRVLEYFAAEVSLRGLPRPVEEQIAGHPVPEADTAPGAQLFVSLDKGLGFDAIDVGVTVYALRSSAPGGADGGVGLSPYAFGTSNTNFPLSDTLSFVLSAAAALQGGLALILRAGRDPELLTGLIETTGSGSPATSFSLSLRNAAPPGKRHELFSAPGLFVDAAAITAGVGVTAGAGLNPSLIVGIEDGRVRVVPDRGDGFLASILPADGITTTINFDVSWSHRDGVRIHGGAGLRTSIVLHSTVGPLRLETLNFALEPATDSIALATTLTGAVTLGPLVATVDGVGTVVELRFERGNLGRLDLDIGFKPPTGVGLSIDTAVVQGAGSLTYDESLRQYAGSLGLRVGGRFDLNVAGLLTTRMPDGSDGYSLLLAGVLRFPAIPVGFGFSLNKLGALVGIDRTTDVDALTGALAAGNLDSVIFPANPAAMVSLPDALGKLFPIKKDAHTVGIMAGFSWGRASLAQIDLGFFYDTSAPARIVAIGRLTVERPRVTLRLLALGVLDFDRGEFDLQARLVESRILGVDLFGDAAIMLRWGQDPNFVLSIGGFHPDYHPPTEFTRRFPPLRRVTIRAHTDESVLRLAFEAYLAITSNTVQMGARVDFGVSVSALSVDGMVSFDALIQIDPALFINVTVRGSVALKVAGVTIIGAKVAAQLIGPGDWYAVGTATITVLWWDIDFGFETGGDKPAAPELPIIDGAAVLAASLANASSWSALATAQSRLISVRRPSTPGRALLFHPLDDLTVRQPVVPLGVVVTRMEEGRLAAPRTFEVAVKVGGTKMRTESVWDAFARAKYMDMSDAARLSTSSFEPMVSGARVVLDQSAAPAPSVNAGWDYDEFVWTANGLQLSTVRRFVPDEAAVAHALASSATAQAPLRRSGVARYRGPLAGQVMLERGGGS